MDAVIGYDVLNAFRVTIDYYNSTCLLEWNNPKTFRDSVTAVVLDKERQKIQLLRNTTLPTWGSIFRDEEGGVILPVLNGKIGSLD
jgi:hypothetical protein